MGFSKSVRYLKNEKGLGLGLWQRSTRAVSVLPTSHSTDGILGCSPSPARALSVAGKFWRRLSVSASGGPSSLVGLVEPPSARGKYSEIDSYALHLKLISGHSTSSQNSSIPLACSSFGVYTYTSSTLLLPIHALQECYNGKLFLISVTLLHVATIFVRLCWVS